MNNKELLEFRNKFNKFAIYNNSRITEITEGHAVSEVSISESSMNPIGSVHGAAIFLAVDNACGAAASSYGYAVTTLDTNISYLRPGINCTRISAEANVIKRGKNIIVLRFSVTDQNKTVLAEGMATFAAMKKTMKEVYEELSSRN